MGRPKLPTSNARQHYNGRMAPDLLAQVKELAQGDQRGFSWMIEHLVSLGLSIYPKGGFKAGATQDEKGKEKG